jgi:hypothetical protein
MGGSNLEITTTHPMNKESSDESIISNTKNEAAWK